MEIQKQAAKIDQVQQLVRSALAFQQNDTPSQVGRAPGVDSIAMRQPSFFRDGLSALQDRAIIRYQNNIVILETLAQDLRRRESARAAPNALQMRTTSSLIQDTNTIVKCVKELNRLQQFGVPLQRQLQHNAIPALELLAKDGYENLMQNQVYVSLELGQSSSLLALSKMVLTLLEQSLIQPRQGLEQHKHHTQQVLSLMFPTAHLGLDAIQAQQETKRQAAQAILNLPYIPYAIEYREGVSLRVPYRPDMFERARAECQGAPSANNEASQEQRARHFIELLQKYFSRPAATRSDANFFWCVAQPLVSEAAIGLQGLNSVSRLRCMTISLSALDARHLRALSHTAGVNLIRGLVDSTPPTNLFERFKEFGLMAHLSQHPISVQKHASKQVANNMTALGLITEKDEQAHEQFKASLQPTCLQSMSETLYDLANDEEGLRFMARLDHDQNLQQDWMNWLETLPVKDLNHMLEVVNTLGSSFLRGHVSSVIDEHLKQEKLTQQQEQKIEMRERNQAKRSARVQRIQSTVESIPARALDAVRSSGTHLKSGVYKGGIALAGVAVAVPAGLGYGAFKAKSKAQEVYKKLSDAKAWNKMSDKDLELVLRGGPAPLALATNTTEVVSKAEVEYKRRLSSGYAGLATLSAVLIKDEFLMEPKALLDLWSNRAKMLVNQPEASMQVLSHAKALLSVTPSDGQQHTRQLLVHAAQLQMRHGSTEDQWQSLMWLGSLNHDEGAVSTVAKYLEAQTPSERKALLHLGLTQGLPSDSHILTHVVEKYVADVVGEQSKPQLFQLIITKTDLPHETQAKVEYEYCRRQTLDEVVQLQKDVDSKLIAAMGRVLGGKRGFSVFQEILTRSSSDAVASIVDGLLDQRCAVQLFGRDQHRQVLGHFCTTAPVNRYNHRRIERLYNTIHSEPMQKKAQEWMLKAYSARTLVDLLENPQEGMHQIAGTVLLQPSWPKTVSGSGKVEGYNQIIRKLGGPEKQDLVSVPVSTWLGLSRDRKFCVGAQEVFLDWALQAAFSQNDNETFSAKELENIITRDRIGGAVLRSAHHDCIVQAARALLSKKTDAKTLVAYLAQKKAHGMNQIFGDHWKDMLKMAFNDPSLGYKDLMSVATEKFLEDDLSQVLQRRIFAILATQDPSLQKDRLRELMDGDINNDLKFHGFTQFLSMATDQDLLTFLADFSQTPEKYQSLVRHPSFETTRPVHSAVARTLSADSHGDLLNSAYTSLNSLKLQAFREGYDAQQYTLQCYKTQLKGVDRRDISGWYDYQQHYHEDLRRVARAHFVKS